jgi:hypothetical protein
MQKVQPYYYGLTNENEEDKISAERPPASCHYSAEICPQRYDLLKSSLTDWLKTKKQRLSSVAFLYRK